MSSGTTEVYWYPMGTGNLQTITLPFVTDLQDDDPVVEAATATTIAGGMYRQLYGDHRRIVIVRQHLRPDDATEGPALRGLRSLQSHLIAGYSVGIAVGLNRAYGSYVLGASLPRGLTGVMLPANRYYPWDSSATLAAGNEIAIESPSPDGAREVHKVSSVTTVGTGLLVNLTEALRYDHPGPVLVRRRTFYPHLKLPADQLDRPIITSSSLGRTFDLRLELAEDPREQWVFAESGELLGTPTGDWGRSPHEITRGL